MYLHERIEKALFFLNYLVLLYYGIKEFNTYQGFLCYFIPLS